MSKRRKKREKMVELNVLEQINLNAAGIDVGDEEMYVAVPEGRTEENVRAFGTFTLDLQHIAEWLGECGVKTVVMEATGVYWIPLYEILEEKGFSVNLVNARHAKNVSGRKSDVLDCQWLQQLHSYGLLQASFRPSAEICALRAVVRHREMLVRYRSAHIQHMQKALQLMNLKLSNVISDITGVTGLNIIRSIVAGERDEAVLASFRQKGCKQSEAVIAKSLQGNYQREHLFALQQSLELYDFYDQQLQACDQELEALYQDFEPVEPPATAAPAPKTQKRRKNQPHFDLSASLYQMTGVDLTQIDGLDALSVQTILSEVGLDMTAWPTYKHFSAWLRLAPNNKITGGKVKSRRTLPSTNRAATAFRIAAQSLARSQCAVGAFYRRKRAQLGPPKAITATAHKLARIFYTMLKHRRPYQDPGADYYEKQHQARYIRSLERKAASVGMRLEPATLSHPTVS